MKQYIIRISAFALAVSFSAFTRNERVAIPATAFYYQSSNFSQTEVQNKLNWSTTPNGANCNGSNKACMVVVDDIYVSGSAFISTVTLDAENSETAAALLDVRNDGVSTNPVISNRP